MVSPIYDLNPTIGITKPTFPAGAADSTLDSGAVNGIGVDHIVVKEGEEVSGPKNPPTTWSAGS